MPDTILPNTLLYSSASLDRAAHRRTDSAWLGAARAATGACFVIHWRGKLLIETLASPRAVLNARPRDPDFPVSFLGILHGAPVFAADLSAEAEPMAALADARGEFLELRGLTGALPEDEAGLLATARGLLYWQSHARFCGICGGACIAERAGHTMRCTRCDTEHFPRTDPAVIMLVEREGRILLGQSQKFPVERNIFSTLAGFVEPGESLEDAVRREVFEETGVRIGAVHYLGSQPWPFPASLMLGYRAEAESGTIVLDTEEMRAARWFTRTDIENRREAGFNLPPKDSIARRLIDDWMAEG